MAMCGTDEERRVTGNTQEATDGWNNETGLNARTLHLESPIWSMGRAIPVSSIQSTLEYIQRYGVGGAQVLLSGL